MIERLRPYPSPAELAEDLDLPHAPTFSPYRCQIWTAERT